MSAILEKPVAAGSLDADRVRALVLIRIACADGLSRSNLATDLAPLLAHRLPLAHWRLLMEREIEALSDAGLTRLLGSLLKASDAGAARAAIFLGLKGTLTRSWEEVHDVRLVAKALGAEREPARRLAALASPGGLRAAILERAFGLKLKGVATPSRLRAALAQVALERAFGNQIKPGLSGKLGLSAKAGRLLAAQLANKPRDFGTDARLIAALAAEHVGAARGDVAALRLALLRGYLDGAGKPTRLPLPQRTPPLRPRLVSAPPIPVEMCRPDLAGFVQEVRQHAAARAQGWPGNRKAYIGQVWQLVRERCSKWGLTEIEFKCMLIEAHRAGSLVLAHADLKDASNICELQDSAVVYKNAVFHFVRVDG